MPSARKTPSGRWRGEYRDQHGRKHARTFATKTAAKTWAAEREAEVRRGVWVDPTAGRLTLEAWCEAWWSARVTEASSRSTDRGRIDKHILPTFGQQRLAAISTLQVQGWVRRLQADGLAPATVRACHQLLSAMLKAAAVDERLVRNPATGVRLPTVPAGREVFLTRAQVDAVVAELRKYGGKRPDERYAVVALFLVLTGCRWGEAAGLPLRNVDMLRREVTFAQALQEVDGVKTVKPYGKTRSSRRTVALPAELVDELAAHLARNPAGRDELVFRGPKGGAMSRAHFNTRIWRPALAAAKLDGLRARPHDLRHTCASWLVQAGLSLFEVQAQLGHESPTMSGRYSHLAPNRHDRVRDALEALAR